MVTSFYRQIKLRWIKQFVQNSLGIKTYTSLWVAAAKLILPESAQDKKTEFHFIID